MQNTLNLQIFIEPGQAGSYFTLPFPMPPDTERLHLTYHYERHRENESRGESGSFFSRREINIIDLGLVAPDGSQVGASGSDKTEIWISETQATPGYNAARLAAGEWQILVGAYKVAPEGVHVTYKLEFIPKHLRLLKGHGLLGSVRKGRTVFYRIASPQLPGLIQCIRRNCETE